MATPTTWAKRNSASLSLPANGANGSPAAVVSSVVSTGSPATLQTSLVGIRRLDIETSNFDATHKLVLANPRVYCNASSLPTWDLNEVK